ncbi:hypothetical protein [Paenarthrobacter sp. NPDC090522]|uniref:hypothetical protein n=1 Tax=Paenarthrobacter sp. NPDC090522 TaxID=3364383 RepID=UPI0038050DEE
MSESDEDVSRAVASHTHLFPGAVLRTDLQSLRETSRLAIVFSDGSLSHAEIVSTTSGSRAEIALAVDSYRTAAGAIIPQKLWSIDEQLTDKEEEGILRVSAALPFT